MNLVSTNRPRYISRADLKRRRAIRIKQVIAFIALVLTIAAGASMAWGA